jgi:hypothetical protein
MQLCAPCCRGSAFPTRRTPTRFFTHSPALLAPSLSLAVPVAVSQDPVDAGYAQLLCASSDEDEPHGATDSSGLGAGASSPAGGPEAGLAAADRMLQMLEADYLRCLEAEARPSAAAHAQPATGGRTAMEGAEDCRGSGHKDGGVSLAAAEPEGTASVADIGTSSAPLGDGGGDAAAVDCISTDSAGSDTDAMRVAAGTDHAPAAEAGALAPAADVAAATRAADGGAFAQAAASSSIGDVQAAMAGITLPPSAWPSWAQNMGEKELIERLRTNV